ncbi:MAG: tetratricopeptide repeat protein [Deltaproteobacteria bacterium]
MALKEKILDRAQRFIQKGYLDKAIQEYKAAAEVDPKDISIRLRIGDLHVKTGNKAEAAREYTEAARANALRGFYLKAIAVYKQVLKLEDSLEVHSKLAELYIKQKLTADAISEYSYILSTFEKKGKIQEVVDLLKKMLDVDADNNAVRLKLADIYQKQGFDKDALAEYAAIFKRMLSLNDLDKAERFYSVLLGKYPNNTEILKGLLDVARGKGDNGQFLRHAKPLFEAYRSTDDTGPAKELCREILERRPDDKDASAFLGQFTEKPVGPVAPSHTPEEAVEHEPPLVEFPELKISTEAGVIEVSVEEEAHVEGERPLIPAGEEEAIEILFEGFEEPQANKDEDTGEIREQGPAGTERPEQPEEFVEVEIREDAGVEPIKEPAAEVSGKAEDEAEGEERIEVKEAASTEEIKEVPRIETELGGIVEGLRAQVAEFEIPHVVELNELSEEAVPLKIEEFEEKMFEPAEAVEEKARMQADHAEELSEGLQEAALEAEPPEAPGVKEAEYASEVDRELSEAISELKEKIEPEEVARGIRPDAGFIETAEEEARQDEFVDLSRELGMEEALENLTESWGAAQPKETHDEFKTSMVKQLGKEDSETHYNLGIAYMEMGLHGEASKEFKIAMQNARLEFDCYIRLGLCAMAEQNPEEAKLYYLKGLKIRGRTEDERKGMMYELALAYEAAGNKDEAGHIFSSIYDVDPSYREVGKKAGRPAPLPETNHIPLDDNLIEVELL